MSTDFDHSMAGGERYEQGILSGDMLSISDKLQQVKSNVSFRLNSAREMLMGIGDEGAMSPGQRRNELRQRRLELLGITSGSDGRTSPSRTSPSPSGQIGERSKTNASGGTPQSQPSTKTGGSPLMSEVNTGTKARAEERGFGT